MCVCVCVFCFIPVICCLPMTLYEDQDQDNSLADPQVEREDPEGILAFHSAKCVP